MMVPVGTLVVLRGTQKKDLLRATAYLVWPGLLAPVLAPLVGGALTQFLSWHWIFLVNHPVGAGRVHWPPSAWSRRAQRTAPAVLDWLGTCYSPRWASGALVIGPGTRQAAGRPRHRQPWAIAAGLGFASTAAVVL